jgi:hypothetical protein
VNLRLDPPHRVRLLRGELEPVGQLQHVRGAGVVVQLGGEGVAGALAREEVGDAVGGNRFDLAILEASVGLLACLVSFRCGVVGRSTADGRGDEQDRREGSGYAAAASQRSQARS